VPSYADDKKATLLVALDLSAAFDRIDIDTLVRHLKLTFGISSSAVQLLPGCAVLDRQKAVCPCWDSKSTPAICEFGVPQGSVHVLGPILHTLHVAPVAKVIQSLGADHTQYADDTQLFISLSTTSSANTLDNCLAAVYNWFTINGLSLNPDKSDA